MQLLTLDKLKNIYTHLHVNNGVQQLGLPNHGKVIKIE